MAAAPHEQLVVVGLGSNLGDPLAHLQRAVAGLRQNVDENLSPSSLYRTAPIGPEQPDFLNAAVLVNWPGSLWALLDCLQRLEQVAGRLRTLRWGPRSLDLDVLWAGERTVQTERLEVPHPRLEERRFALLPLLELVPEAISARSGRPLGAVLAQLPEQAVVRVEGPGWAKTLPLP